MTKTSRAEHSERTFPEARFLAAEHGMVLTNPSDGCFQLRWGPGWIVNLYPRHQGLSPRMYHDPRHRGPFLQSLPENWTLLQAVEAAIVEFEKVEKAAVALMAELEKRDGL